MSGVSDHDWVGVTHAPLPVGAALDWAVVPSCGAVVCFTGTVRDHAEGRDGVESLTYEAYEEFAVTRLRAIAGELRQRWPDTGRVVLLHRTGELSLGDTAVAVIVSTPHRDAAFAAARFGIDAVKSSVPIWKRERWAAGEAWGGDAQTIRPSVEVS